MSLKLQVVLTTLCPKSLITNHRCTMLASVKCESGQDKDEIFDLLSLLKEHQAMEEGGFLEELQIGSTPCAILASKR